MLQQVCSPLNQAVLRVVMGLLLTLLILPFPLVFFIQQILALFIVNEHMSVLTTLLLFGEGALGASPQLLMLVYILMSDAEREVAIIQKVTIASSVLTIAKTSVELF